MLLKKIILIQISFETIQKHIKRFLMEPSKNAQKEFKTVKKHFQTFLSKAFIQNNSEDFQIN